MDKTTLVGPDSDRIRQGNEFLVELEKSGFPVHAALWLYASEQYSDWRLVIASPLVDEKGPLAAYKKLDSILHKSRPDLVLWMQCVQLVSPRDALIRDLDKTYFRGRPTPEGISLIGSTAGNTYIEQAHLYWPHGTTE